MKHFRVRMRELGLLNLEKKRLCGILIMVFKHLKGAYQKDGERLIKDPGVTRQGEMAPN